MIEDCSKKFKEDFEKGLKVRKNDKY